MAIPSPIDPKSTLRNAMRRLARDTPGDSSPVCEAVFQWLAARPALHTIAVFAALPGEVDLALLVARHPDHRWVYPRVIGNGLMFHCVRNPRLDLIPGAFGIREPAPTLPEVDFAQIDAFLCPGLAFDKRGGRLGRGRGYYDRLLAAARPDALKLGICFPHQLVADTFPQAHDIHMDAIISG